MTPPVTPLVCEVDSALTMASHTLNNADFVLAKAHGEAA
jgi:hypothetical protein